MTETNSTVEKGHQGVTSPALKATRLSELPVAGLVLAVRPALRKCSNTALSSDLNATDMLEEVIRAYNSNFAHITAQESMRMLESVGEALYTDVRGTSSKRAASADAASIAKKLEKFDSLVKPAYGRSTPSTYLYEMLADTCRYAKGGTFKAIGFSIYDAMKEDEGRPALGALNKPGFNDGIAFQLSSADITAMAHLARSLPPSSEYSWVYAANAISDAASFSNDFLLKEGPNAAALLYSAIDYISRNANVLRRENVEGIEKIALSLFASRASALHQLNGNGVEAGIKLSRRMQDYKDNPIGLRIFNSALGIMASQLSGEKISIEISRNGFPYLKGNRQFQMEYFTSRLASMRKRLGNEFKDVEGIAIACLDIVVKNEGFRSNGVLLRKLDTLRKELYFSWIGSTNEETRAEMDESAAAIRDMLKGARTRSRDAFSLFVDSVSLIYGLGVHVEKVGSLVSIARNR